MVRASVFVALCALVVPSLEGCDRGGAAPSAATPTTQVLGGATIVRIAPPPFQRAERCFNALDDNDNGLLDEGCDVPQGSIQVALSWQSLDDELDLVVSDPEGQIATTAGPTALGFVLDQDCPSDDACLDQPYEVVYLDSDERVDGTLTVIVRAIRLDPATSDGRAVLGIKEPGGTRSYEIRFDGSEREARLRFRVVAPEAEAE